MSSWKPVGIVVEGEPISIHGVDPWRFEWQSMKETVVLSHPQYPEQIHEFSVCEIEAYGRKVKFAVGEVSNGVYGFYVPQ